MLAVFAACETSPEPEPQQPTPSPVIEFPREAIAFGPQFPGVRVTKMLRLTNKGPGTAQVGLTIEGEGAAAFGLSTSSFSLDEGQSDEAAIEFAPAAAGEFTARLRLALGEEALGSIELSGASHDASCTVEVAPVALGAVIVGGSRVHAIELANSGRIGFDFSAELTDAAGAGLALEPLETNTLAPGAKTTLSVAFRPEAMGDAAGTLRILAPSCERDIAVSATGVEAVVTAEELDFGYVHPGSTATRRLRVRNIGHEQVELSSFAVEGNTEFAVEQHRFSIPGGGSLDVGPLTFSPLSAGAKSGSLVISLDHPVQKSAATKLSGWGGGPDIELPAQVDLGTVAVGSWAIQRVRVLNAGSNVPGTTLDNLVFGGPDQPIAVVGNDPAFELLPVDESLATVGLEAGASAEFQIRFKPTAPGLHSASLLVASNDPDAAEQLAVVQLVATAEVLPDCSWSLSSETLDFGDVGPARTRMRTLQVRNEGTTVCHVGAPRIFGSSAFSLVDAPDTSVLAPGATLELTVRFSPPATGAHAASLVAYTSSQSLPEIAVPLDGRGWSSCLELLPVIDLGEVELGCSAARSVDIYNACNSNLMITDSSGAGAGFSVAMTGAAPVTIPSFGKQRFLVRFQPTRDGKAYGSLRVVASDGRVLTAELRGSGATGANRVDTFTAGQDKVDVLLIGDDGSGVPSNLTKPIAAQALFAPARAAGIDFHVAVTTTSTDEPSSSSSYGPMGRFIPASRPAERVLTSATPNFDQLFARNMDIGDGGSPVEQPLEAFLLALSPDNLAGHNGGFLRPDARLHVVFMTNAADQSTRPVSFYEDFAAQLVATGQTKSVTLSGIVPTLERATSFCSYDEPNSGLSMRTRELITWSGGLLREYCEAINDIPGATSALADQLFGPNLDFALRSAIDTSTPLTVRVNGRVVPQLDDEGGANWTVDAASRTLRLAPAHALGSGDTLEVAYQGICQP